MTTENRLSDYIYSSSDLLNIKFDEYNRPYLQDKNGRLMLSRKSNYNYSILN